MAYAARCLIRLASLLPHAANLRQVGKDVESLAGVIAGSRGIQISEQLHHALLRARQDRVLPPSSRIPSPVPEWDTMFGDFSWADGWDFGTADQLLASVDNVPFWERSIAR